MFTLLHNFLEEILNNQFSSVFTKEDCENLADLGQDIPVEAPPH